jgi:hypothetical protein
MTRAAVPALTSALALRRSPRTALPEASGFLPGGVLLLIRIVAGDETAIAEAKEASAEPIEVLRDASGFYLQQILFAADANSYRVLGVNPEEEDARIREHYRWLARWLHPDRNPDAWEVVYADRVSNAWQNLRTPERRARYDEGLGEAAMPAPTPAAPVRAMPAMSMPARHLGEYEPPPAPINLRWLPPAILGVLGAAALGVVFLYILRVREQAELQDVAAAPAAEPEVRLARVQLQPKPAPAAVGTPQTGVVDTPPTSISPLEPATAAASAAPKVAAELSSAEPPIVAKPSAPVVPAAPVQEPSPPRAPSIPQLANLARHEPEPAATPRPSRQLAPEPAARAVAATAEAEAAHGG